MKRMIVSSTDWESDPKYKNAVSKYLPDYGEGDNKAEQVVTAMNRLMFKWWNDGDVYDNHWANGLYTEGVNDLSSEANWLYKNGPRRLKFMMQGVHSCESEEDYEDLLSDIASQCFKPEYLEEASLQPKVGSVYNCDGPFSFEEYYEDEDGEEGWY